MESTYKTELWNEFGAAIDMFENAIVKCPEHLWTYNYSTGKDTLNAGHIDEVRSSYWYIAFHTLFFLDYYLESDPADFKMSETFNIKEEDIDEVMPDRIFTKDELLTYVKHCREKARKLISGFTDKTFTARWIDQYRNYGMYEMQFYNMRHVMHHTGQLNMLLGRIDHSLPIWVSQTKIKL